MADSDSILQLGIEAARAGDKAEARELFRLVTRQDPTNAQGWLWLAGVAEDREEKRAALERVVTLEPHNDLAQKGLTALGGARVSSPAPTAEWGPVAVPPTPVTATPPPDENPVAATPPDETPVAATSPPDETPMAATPLPEETPAAVPGRSAGARQYDVPDVPPPAAPGADTWAAPTYDTEELGPRDSRQFPAAQPAPPVQPVAVDPQTSTGTRVVVEDEEPAGRRRLGWLPLALATVALILIGAFYWGSRTPADPGLGIAGDSTVQATSTLTAEGADGVGALPVTENTETAEAVADTTTPADAAGGVEQTPPATEATVPAADVTAPVADATAAPAADVTAAPAADVTAAPADTVAPPPEATSAPAGETIVVVPPGATVEPTPAAPPEAAPPAPAPPATSPDVATANPAIVPLDTVVQAGSWSFTYGGVKNVTNRPYAGGPPSRGQFQIVLLAIGNNGPAPATVPDGFFVLKDAQGRVYDFNRAASVEYFVRTGGAGVAADIGADAQVPNNNALTSMPLLFDVPPDATNLVLLSRDNLNQGFVIR